MDTPTVPQPGRVVGTHQAVREERVGGPIPTELANLAGTIEKLHARISDLAETMSASLSESGPPSTTPPTAARNTHSALGQMLADMEQRIDAAADRIGDLNVRCEL